MDDKELAELIEKARTKDKLRDDRRNLDNSVYKFMIYKGIREGNQRVPTYVLLCHYLRYTKLMGIKPLKSIVFFRELSKVLKTSRTGQQRYYHVEVYEMTKEVKEDAKRFMIRSKAIHRGNNEKKEKQSTEQDEVSSIEETSELED